MLLLLLQTFIIDGKSVEPVYHDEQAIEVIHAPCAVDDYIAFEYEDERYIKQLKAYRADGYVYVLGRPDTWVENGEKRKSLDSTTWGWIDVNILGCVL